MHASNRTMKRSTVTATRRSEPGRVSSVLPVALDVAVWRLMVAALAVITIALIAPPGAGAATTSFDPQEHGFHFRNQFSVKVKLRFPKPIGLKSINLGKHNYGLCGGMTYAALDHFLARRPIPPDITQPRLGSPLYSYILRRQLDTLTLGTLAKFAEMPFDSTVDLTHRSRRAFQDAIRGTLDRGRPVPLGLIKTKGLDNFMTGNHQVLAIGYSLRPVIITTKRCVLGFCKTKRRRDNEPVIAVYDPNYPGRTTYIQTNHNAQTWDREGTQRIGRVRGYFATPYRQASPPAAPPPPPPLFAPPAPEPPPPPPPPPPPAAPPAPAPPGSITTSLGFDGLPNHAPVTTQYLASHGISFGRAAGFGLSGGARCGGGQIRIPGIGGGPSLSIGCFINELAWDFGTAFRFTQPQRSLAFQIRLSAPASPQPTTVELYDAGGALLERRDVTLNPGVAGLMQFARPNSQIALVRITGGDTSPHEVMIDDLTYSRDP